MRIFKGLLVFILGVAAVAVLAFLVTKVQDVKQDKQESALKILLKIDAGASNIEASVLRSSVGNNAVYEELDNTITYVEDQLKEFLLLYPEDSLETSQELKDLIYEKIDFASQFKNDNNELKNAIAKVLEVSSEISNTEYDQVIEASKINERISAESINILDRVLEYNLFPTEKLSKDLEETIKGYLDIVELMKTNLGLELSKAVQKNPKLDKELYTNSLRKIFTLASSLSVAAENSLTYKVKVNKVIEDIQSVPIATTIDKLDKEIQETIDAHTKEVRNYKFYLIGYTVFLLLLVFIFAIRLMISFRKLGELNSSLEKRVDDRTSDLNKAMEELRSSEAVVIQSEKMASLGQMVAGVAHEINTPLAYVRSSLESLQTNIVDGPLQSFILNSEQLIKLMLDENCTEEQMNAQFAQSVEALSKVDGQYKEMLSDMSSLINDGIYGVDQIKELVINLRNFSRLDQSKVDFVSLDETIETVLKLVKHETKERNIIKLLQETPKIKCSPNQINQVFLNILVNAVQATSDKLGVITIATSTIEDAKKVAVTITDNGKGMPADIIDKVFDPFFTTKEVGKGTGLGLSICYKIVQEHGGNIRVLSTPDVGTKFIIELPVDYTEEIKNASVIESDVENSASE